MGTTDSQLLLSKITVSDLARSYAFYTEVLGLRHAVGRQGTPPPDLTSKAPFVEIPLNFTGSLADPFFVIQTRTGVKSTRDAAALTVVGFKVPDARAVIQRVKNAGYPPEREPRATAPGENIYAFVQDPDGYNVELIQAPGFAVTGGSSEHDRRPNVTGKNLIHSTGLNVADMDRALKFFIDGLGMTEQNRFAPSPATLEVWVGYANNRESDIMLVHSKNRTGPVAVGEWGRMVLYVKDVRAMVDSVARAGVGKLLRGPSAQPANKVTTANVESPDGHRIELVQFD
jgi:lactoylglutathione lyase